MNQITEIDVQQPDRYSRLNAIKWWNQACLSKAQVLVAGAGALGNEVLKNLALIGVGYIYVVDFDTVEVTNLSRSILFRPGDEGLPKATIAAQRLHEINPDIQVEAHVGDVVWDIGLGWLRRFDLVIGCLDNREARLGLNRSCWKMGVPWIDGALGALTGQVRLYSPPETACYECDFMPQDYQELNLRYSCQLLAEERTHDDHIPTTPGSASIIGAIQVQEALKLLHGHPTLTGYEIDYDGQYHRYRTIALKKYDECLSHESIPSDRIKLLPMGQASTLTDRELLAHIQKELGSNAYIELDREIITQLTCPKCRQETAEYHPRHMSGTRILRCPTCGTKRMARFIHKIDESTITDQPLSTLGIPPGHILQGRWQRNKIYYELSGDIPFERKQKA